jgi:hypothetical protein
MVTGATLADQPFHVDSHHSCYTDVAGLVVLLSFLLFLLFLMTLMAWSAVDSA